jgi:hypothetical protein
MAWIRHTIEVSDKRMFSLEVTVPEDIPKGRTIVNISIVPKALDAPRMPLRDFGGF